MVGGSERWLKEKGMRCVIRFRFQHVFLNLMDSTSERSDMKSCSGKRGMRGGVKIVFEIMREMLL